MREIDRALVHGEVHCDVAALRNQRDTSFDGLSAKQIWPERALFQIVHQPEAIGPHERHITGCLDKFVLELLPFFPHLCKTRGIADTASGPGV